MPYGGLGVNALNLRLWFLFSCHDGINFFVTIYTSMLPYGSGFVNLYYRDFYTIFL